MLVEMPSRKKHFLVKSVVMQKIEPIATYHQNKGEIEEICVNNFGSVIHLSLYE